MGLSSGRSSSDFGIFQNLKSMVSGGFNLGTSMSDVESVNENVIEDGQLWYGGPDGLHKHSLYDGDDKRRDS